jgi:predicted small integral membrane protein
MVMRSAKVFLTASVGLLLLLVGVNNIFDFGTNFEVVQHILSMDALPPGAALTGRAITSATLHNLAYWLIITVEFSSGGLCVYGAFRLFTALRLDSERFEASKDIAALGLTLALALYLTGFMAIGGEWFQMWRAGVWNMQDSAFRFIGMIAFTLIFLAQPDQARAR